MNNAQFVNIKENIIVKNELDKYSTYIIIVLFSFIIGALMLRTDGNILAVCGFVTAVSILVITFYRVDWGFYLFISMVLLFDQFHIPESDPITYKIDYFKNLKQIPYMPHFSAGVMNPIELQLILMLLAWFIAISVRKRTRVQHIPVWGLAVIFFISLIVALMHGLTTGGTFLPSLWELRALFYFGFLYFFVPQIIQSKDQLETLFWIFIIFITIKAIQGAARFVFYGFSFRGLETLTNHEDPVFITLLIIFLLSMIVLDCKSKQRTTLFILFTPLVLGFFAGQRRAAYAGLFISLIAFVILLNRNERMILLKAFFPFFIFGIIFCAAFWNSNSKLASPVKLVKSGFTTSKKEDGERYLSNLYRKFERYDLAVTFRTSPVTGLGFGKKYQLPIPLPAIPFPLRDYIPHDEILWILIKTGAVGFFIFWLFFDSLLFHGSALSKKIHDPYLRSICIVIVIAIINQMVVSYYDLQLTYYRNMIVLGTLCGLLPAIKFIDKNENKEQVEETVYEDEEYSESEI